MQVAFKTCCLPGYCKSQKIAYSENIIYIHGSTVILQAVRQ